MKRFPKLTLKSIQKKHSKNTQDKELHKIIETETIKKKDFDKLITKAVNQEPFDKKKGE